MAWNLPNNDVAGWRNSFLGTTIRLPPVNRGTFAAGFTPVVSDAQTSAVEWNCWPEHLRCGYGVPVRAPYFSSNA